MVLARKQRKQRYEAGILQQRLRRQVGQAIGDYAMLTEGDRVMVCVSGGKDSHALLELLRRLQPAAPIRFELLAVLIDQGQPGFCAKDITRYFKNAGVNFRLVQENTYSIVTRVVPAGKTTCALCSRLRRGVLYRVAAEEGATKIALGHHADDIIETLFLNMFYGGALKAMPPLLRSDDGRHVVIRPLAYCRERDLAAYAAHWRFPIIPCNLCGADGGGARRQIKKLLADWERAAPGRINNIFSALANVAPSHLLDRALFDFEGAAAAAEIDSGGAGGDVGFIKPPAAGGRALFAKEFSHAAV